MSCGPKQFGPTSNGGSKNPDTEEWGWSIQEETVQNQPGHREKRTSVRAAKRKNALISSAETTRVLRSRSQEKPKAPESSSKNLVEDGGAKQRKKKEKVKNVSVDEFTRVKRNLSYLVNRIKYEQTLINAYSGEGWKGQSVEKIKPEKELQRAKSEILLRKLKIRDLFQHLHMLCTDQSLFDSTGNIDSEDLFCAKCGSREFPANKDIILCDGVCELHLYEDNWFCPACYCKFECTNMLNDLQGTNLSIIDNWEKVFPEAAAAAAAGKNLDENHGLTSDDSEDEDYDPDGPVLSPVLNKNVDESDSDSSSEGSKALPNVDQYLGLPSDDSEDDDFNPGIEEVDGEIKQESSGSDFTSDSEDFSVAFDNKRHLSEDEAAKSDSVKFKGEGDSDVLSGRRNVERLDYKKLHDINVERVSGGIRRNQIMVRRLNCQLVQQMGSVQNGDERFNMEEYGNSTSDSSDEDFMDGAAPKKRMNKRGKVDSVSPSSGGSTTDSSDSEHTPKRRTRNNLLIEGTSKPPARTPSSGKTSSKSTNKRLGEAVTQRLYEYFKKNQYPDLAMKESLAKELGITANQVNKWFTNTRWSHRHPSSKKLRNAEHTSKDDDT